MGRDAAHAGFPRNTDHLVHRGHDANAVVGLVTDVAGVHAAIGSRHLRQLDQLLRGGKAPGRVVRPTRHPERPVVHAGPHEVLHPLEFRRCGRTVLHAKDGSTNGSVWDQQCRVHPEPVAEQVCTLSVEVHGATTVGVEHRGRDPLRQERRRVAQLRRGQTASRMGVHVDEPGRHIEARRVDDQCCRGTRQSTHRHDTVADDREVGSVPRVSRAVQHASVHDEDVVRRGLLRGHPCDAEHSRQPHSGQHAACERGSRYVDVWPSMPSPATRCRHRLLRGAPAPPFQRGSATPVCRSRSRSTAIACSLAK